MFYCVGVMKPSGSVTRIKGYKKATLDFGISHFDCMHFTSDS